MRDYTVPLCCRSAVCGTPQVCPLTSLPLHPGLRHAQHVAHPPLAVPSSLPARTRLLKGVLGLGPRLSLISVHPNGRQLAAKACLLSSGTLRPPRISATFPLEQAGEAHAFLEGARGPRPPGKVVLQVARPILADKGGQTRAR